MTQKIKSASAQAVSEREPFYFRPRNADYFRGVRSRLDVGERTSYFWAIFSVPLMILIGWMIWLVTMETTNNSICGIAGGIFAFILAMAVIGGTDEDAKKMQALTSGKAKIIDSTYTYCRVFEGGRSGTTFYVAYEFVSPMSSKVIKETEERSLGIFERHPTCIPPCPGRVLYLSDNNYKTL